MLPQRPGRYKARVIESGLTLLGDMRLATVVVNYQCIAELVHGEWLPIDEDVSICGYHFIQKRDGSLNQHTINALRDALGWDGLDVRWFEQANLRDVDVQLSCDWEEFEGQQRMRVKFLNPADYAGGGVPHADAALMQSLAAQLNPKLRAFSGGAAPARPAQAARPAPAAPPAPANETTTRGAPPPARPPAARPASSSTAPTATATPQNQQEAWEFFGNIIPDTEPATLEREWFRILGELFPGRAAQELTPSDWEKFTEQAPGMLVPF
ncbi:MAG: hypothetical protein J5J06_17885 [Phycisphaerae bacterium]|nr:hypothetical protein [Phycisphaerae bacterium]